MTTRKLDFEDTFGQVLMDKPRIAKSKMYIKA